MTLNVDEIKNLPDPYTTLCTDDVLDEHRAELNQLLPDERVELANKIVRLCPEDQLGDLGQKIGEFKSSVDEENDFYYEVKKAYFKRASTSEFPFQMLGTGDALAEYVQELNELQADDMQSLASRLVLGCPEDNLGDFSHAIEALRKPQNDENSFHSVLAQAYEVKKRLLSLMDLKNTLPHLLILKNELDDELFNNFNELAKQVLSGNESKIAGKLAETTPQSDRHEVAQNLKNIFPNSIFAAKVGHAFAVRRDIDNLLLGDNPYTYFSSREFNVDSANEFPGLFKALDGKESSIAEKLALNTTQEQRNTVAKQIRSISAGGELSKKVHTAFTLRRDLDRLLLGDKPGLFFSSRDFSVDLCLEFSALVTSLIKDQELIIGEKLSQITDTTIRNDINLKLERINPEAHNPNSSLRLIAAAMVPKQQIKHPIQPNNIAATSTDAATSHGAQPYNLFNEQIRKTKPIEKPISATDDDSNCCQQFCGLFKK